jgi:hypothetical protein
MNHTRPRRRLPQLRYRAQVAALILAALLTRALWPGVAWAGCGVSDFSACADDAQYTIWYGVATFLWSIDAMLLQMAYLIDVFRVWLIETAFTSAYQALVTVVNPLIVPFATIALIIAVILLLLVPMFGRIRALSVRHVLVWALMAPLLLSISGPLIVQVEQARTQLGAAIFTDISAIAPGAIFGVSATDMPAPTPLYGGNPCGAGALGRPGMGSAPNAMHMDDLAAAMMWANAQDIHCPKFSGEGQDIPDAFYVEPSDGPGFATTRKVGEMNDSSERAAAIQNIQRGVTRLGLGILPSILAVLEMLVNLIFGLALIALWIGLPLALAFIFFEESAGSVAILLRQGLGVLKVSWASSFLMAVLFAALKSSAEMGNAAAYTGLAVGSIILMAWMLITAFSTLGGSIKALNTSVMAGTGLNAAQPIEIAAGAAGLAAGALTGGAAIALAGAAAYKQTGSGRYAAGAALGRIGSLSQVGEVAAAMGWMWDEEAIAGLNAGQRSHQGMRTMRLQMVADAHKKGADGLTIGQRAQERGLAHQVDAATTDQWRSINEGTAVAGQAVVRAYDYTRSGQVLTDARAAGGRMLESIGDRWEDLKQRAVDFGMEVQVRSTTQPGPLAAPITLARGHAALIAAAHDRLSPDRRYDAYSLGENGKLRSEQPRLAGAQPPDALTVPNTAANVPRLLRTGYTVQQNQDGTLTFWQTDPQRAAAAAKAPQKQLQQLYEAQALNAEEIKATAAATLATGKPSEGSPAQKHLEVLPSGQGEYRVREIVGGQVVDRRQAASAAEVAQLAADTGLPVHVVATDPEPRVNGWRVADRESDPAQAPTEPAAVAAQPLVSTPPTAVPSRVDRARAARHTVETPARSPVVSSAPAEVPTVPARSVAPAPAAAGSAEAPTAPASSVAPAPAPTPSRSVPATPAAGPAEAPAPAPDSSIPPSVPAAPAAGLAEVPAPAPAAPTSTPAAPVRSALLSQSHAGPAEAPTVPAHAVGPVPVSSRSTSVPAPAAPGLAGASVQPANPTSAAPAPAPVPPLAPPPSTETDQVSEASAALLPQPPRSGPAESHSGDPAGTAGQGNQGTDTPASGQNDTTDDDTAR